MNDFRKQVKDIKFWNYWVWAGLIVLLLSDVPMLIVLMLGVFFGITFNMPKFILEFMMNMFLMGPVLGCLLIAGGAFAVKKRKICSRCGKRLKIRELEQMGDSFLCPYCNNDRFND